MKNFIACGIQTAVKPNDIKYNIKKSLLWLEKAVDEHTPKLVVFPESITTGFTPDMPPYKFYEKIDFIPGFTTKPICKAAKKHGIYIVWPTYERGNKKGEIYNTAIMIAPDGKIVGKYRKTHPFPTERNWTTTGENPCVVETEIGKIGIMICYDGDFPELSRVLAIKGAEVIVRPSAFLRSYEIWNITNSARAYDNHIYIIGVNAIGMDAGENHYYGHSMIVNPLAHKIAEAGAAEEILSCKLNSEPLKYMSPATKSPMIFNHLDDRNVRVYKEILQETRSPFKRPIKKRNSV